MRHQPRLLGRPAAPAPGRPRPGRSRTAAGGPAPGTAARRSRQHGAQARLARQVLAVGRDVDAGDDDLAVAVLDQRPRLRRDPLGRHAAAGAAAVGDDAEGAAMVAALLDLEEGARAAVEAVDQVRGRLPHQHDVADRSRGASGQPAPRSRPSASRRCRRRGRPRAWRRKRRARPARAQPVTTIRASGRSRRSRRIVCRACRSASAVTAQVLTITVSRTLRRARGAASPRTRSC